MHNMQTAEYTDEFIKVMKLTKNNDEFLDKMIEMLNK